MKKITYQLTIVHTGVILKIQKNTIVHICAHKIRKESQLNQRIKNLKENIQNLNDAGVRKTYLYQYVAESLNKTEGEPTQIRRAKAFAHVLETVEQQVLPYEKLAGTMLGMCPLYENVMSKEEQHDYAIKVIEEYLAKKKQDQNFDGSIQFGEGHAKSFEDDFTSKKSRWSLMSRVHHDASIEFKDLQQVISDMEEKYKDADIEDYEIGRELERAFKIPYDEEIKKTYNELPWFLGNHLNLNYGKMIGKGFEKLITEIKKYLFNTQDPEKKEYYESALIAAQAASDFIKRYAKTLRKYKEQAEISEIRKQEIEKMAEICEKIAVKPADTFYEAIQFTWMLHIIASIQGGSALSFARIDQYLYPYYEKDVKEGRIDAKEAQELLSCLWLKVNEPKMRTVQSVTLGGITRDGKDAANELTRICLQTAADVGMPYPNIGLRINKKNPDWLYTQAVETAKAGCGQPQLLNDDVWITNMKKLGYSEEDANDYYNMGCVEIMVPGKQPNWGVCEAIAFPVLIENVMKEWKKNPDKIQTFEDFMSIYYAEMDKAVEADYQDAVKKKATMKDQCYDPYCSLLIDGCLENGKDMLQGGSECPMHWSVYAYGIGTVADSLCAVKKFIFDEKKITMAEMYDALQHNFEGYEEMQAMLLRETPSYGNGIDEVDDIANDVLSYFNKAVMDLNKKAKTDKFVSTLFGYFFHIYHGEIAGATPDGRMKGEAFSDSMGPSQGRDEQGPTRLLNSVLHLNDDLVTGGYALNFKINPSFLNEEKGEKAIEQLLKAYIENGGPQVQIYTTNMEDLKDAQIHPEKHRDLIVRVGGYCEFFVNLDKVLQTEIIHRTLYGEA